MPVQTQNEALTTEELAYLAGLFDGEGTVTISCYNASRYGGRRRSILMVMLSSTDHSVIDYLIQTFQGSLTVTKAYANRKEIHRWTLSARMAADFLYRVLPYLRIKREHALLGLDWQATIREVGNQHTQLPPTDVLEWREFYINRIRELNVRGNGKSNNA